MKDDEKIVILLALIAFWIWKNKGSSVVSLFEICTFPDGTTINMPLGAPCPFDAAHGGQSAIIDPPA